MSLKEFYVDSDWRPTVFGMTASPVATKGRSSVELESCESCALSLFVFFVKNRLCVMLLDCNYFHFFVSCSRKKNSFDEFYDTPILHFGVTRPFLTLTRVDEVQCFNFL